jgi:DNA-binding CsgD family transcriptional regulator
MENPVLQAATPDYFDPAILRSEQEVVVRSSLLLDEVARWEHGVQMLPQLIKVPLPALRRSDFYNVILRPGGADDVLSLALRTREDRGIGILKLYRRAGDKPFTPQDAAALGRLESRLSLALQPGDTDADATEVCGQGLLVVTLQGQWQWIAPGTEALLAQAFGAHWRSGGELPAAVRLLLQRLFWPAADGPESAPLPQMSLRNVHGWFSLRATRLTGAAGQGEAAAIHVTRRMARGARLLDRLRALGLPQRQSELAYWLARGLPESRIAERMGVSANTVVYHRRQLYARMGVASRAELLASLALDKR